MTPSTTPLNERDNARTPPSLFKILDDRFHFDLDAAATKENALCHFYWSEETHGLEQEWHKLPGMNEDPRVYCNPPYSRGNIDRFIKKGYEESLKGATVVMLLPSDTSTRYFHNYCMKASEIIFLKPRVHFNRPDGTSFKTSPKFGSMVVVFKESEFDGSPVISSLRWK
jgi:site-specific DNA-methyltransferase (adenine-specific)